jgi:hypothetical protein
MDDRFKARIKAAVKEAEGYQAWHEDIPPHLVELIKSKDPEWHPEDRNVLDPEIRKVQRQIDKVDKRFRKFQSQRSRDLVFIYLGAVFKLASFWIRRGRSKKFIRACLQVSKPSLKLKPEVFAIAIFATSDGEELDAKTRSKWSRALRYVQIEKPKSETVRAFMKRHGGINGCAAEFTDRLRRDAWRKRIKGPLSLKRPRKSN